MADRRKEDGGYWKASYDFLTGEKISEEGDRRSGKDRREADLLGEALWGLHKPDSSDRYMGVYDAITAIIQVMERRR